MAKAPTGPRWERLIDSLSDHGVTAEVTARSYPGGVSRTVTIRADFGLVEIGDRWWRKNHDVWIGWNVWSSDREGIVIRDYPLTKKRNEVARNVVDALSTAGKGTS